MLGDARVLTGEGLRVALNRREEMSADFVSLYANETQVAITPWDVCLRLGLLVEGGGGVNDTIVVSRLADVRMSLPHVKKLMEILTHVIEQYERQIGAVALPPM